MTSESPDAVAAAAVLRVRAGLVAMADGDEEAVLTVINLATRQELRWMSSALFRVVDEAFTVLEKRGVGSRRGHLFSTAEHLASSASLTGAEVVVAEFLKGRGTHG